MQVTVDGLDRSCPLKIESHYKPRLFQLGRDEWDAAIALQTSEAGNVGEFAGAGGEVQGCGVVQGGEVG